MPLKFGLVGTGYWARITHAPALASTGGIELAAVWGRDLAAAQQLADQYGAVATADFDEFLALVDGVSFAVPPDVQSPLALRAASAGRHLMLEKPIALTVTEADELVAAVRDSGVASLVFFTAQFQADVRAWLADLGRRDDWAGGSGVWLGSALQDGSPFNTPWRRVKGGLWDLGPHLIALLWMALGPVVSVTADQGSGELTHLVLHHENGATSAITVTMSVPESAELGELLIWGPGGRSAAPTESPDSVSVLRTALTELTELAGAAGDRQPAHRFDVAFGRDIVRVLADAERQVDARST